MILNNFNCVFIFPLQLLHEYWMTLRNRVSAVDELAMATERLRVRHPKEPKPNPPVHHIIEPHEVVESMITKNTAKSICTGDIESKQ